METWIRILFWIVVIAGGIKIVVTFWGNGWKVDFRKQASKAGKSPKHSRNNPSESPGYTYKDKDLILLMCELSEVYRKTDEYLKK